MQEIWTMEAEPLYMRLTHPTVIEHGEQLIVKVTSYGGNPIEDVMICLYKRIDQIQDVQYTNNVGEVTFPIDQKFSYGTMYITASKHNNFPRENSVYVGIYRPTNFQVNGSSYTTAELTWVDNSNVNTGYLTQYNIENTGWQDTPQQPAGANATFIELDDLSPQTNYLFRVRAYEGYENSEWSEEISHFMGGVEDFDAVPLDCAVFLEWSKPNVPFTTEYLVVRRTGDGGIQWTPEDGIDYNNYIGQPPPGGDVQDTIIDIGINLDDNSFYDGDRKNGYTYKYAAFAFDEDFVYTEPAKEDARPTEFVSGWGKSFNIIGNNSTKLIQTASPLDSICVVFLKNRSSRERAKFSDFMYRSKHPDNPKWNDAIGVFGLYAAWNGITISSSKEGNVCMIYKGVMDMPPPEEDKDFIRYLTDYNPNRWWGAIITEDSTEDLYMSHPAMVVSGDSAFISYIGSSPIKYIENVLKDIGK